VQHHRLPVVVYHEDCHRPLCSVPLCRGARAVRRDVTSRRVDGL
jgi:hypothetical protein